MNVLDFALEIEREGIELYKKLSDGKIVKELSGIFLFLAEEEKRHYEIVEAWRNNTEVPTLDNVSILGNPENVFKKLSEHFYIYNTPTAHYYDAYSKACSFEEKSIAFYTNLLDHLENGQKGLMQKIIDQEKEHALFLSIYWNFSGIRENGLKTPSGAISRNIEEICSAFILFT
jgi:rubrerythrin